MAPPDACVVGGCNAIVATRIEGALLLPLGACAGRLTAQAAGWTGLRRRRHVPPVHLARSLVEVVPPEQKDIDALYRRDRNVYGQH